MFKGVLIGLLFGLLAFLPYEPTDDELLFNCKLHGNHQCGPNTPDHGFVNLWTKVDQ